MSFNMKKLTALMLAVLLVLSLFPIVSLAATDQSRKNTTVQTKHGRGYISSPLVGKHLTGEHERGQGADLQTASDPLPSRYDSRDYGYLPPVRDQGAYGTCWSFASIASIEAYMIKHGIINDETGLPADTDINLSETHLAWFSYTDA